jgi:hypothetical protein
VYRFTYSDYRSLSCTGGVTFSRLLIKGRLNLQKINQDRFKLYEIKNSCQLRDAAPFKDTGDFKRGYVYYEFMHEKENISEDKEIILMRIAKVLIFKLY